MHTNIKLIENRNDFEEQLNIALNDIKLKLINEFNTNPEIAVARLTVSGLMDDVHWYRKRTGHIPKHE